MTVERTQLLGLSVVSVLGAAASGIAYASDGHGPGLSEATWATIALAAVAGCAALAMVLYRVQNSRIATAGRVAHAAKEQAERLEPRVATLESQWPIWAQQIQRLEQEQVRRHAELQRSLSDWKDTILSAVEQGRRNTELVMIQHRDNVERVEELLRAHQDSDDARKRDQRIHDADRAKRDDALLAVLEQISTTLGIPRIEARG